MDNCYEKNLWNFMAAATQNNQMATILDFHDNI